MEIFYWQQRIAETLNVYQQKYNYVGQPGHEYDVIFSLFRELNTIKSPGNRHIFWYAAMPVLMESYRRFISQGQLPSLYPLRWGDQQQASSRLVKHSFPSVKEPSYLWSLENYLKGIVTLGIARATKLPVPGQYSHFVLKRIMSQIKALMEKMPPSSDLTDAEIPLVLTVKESTDNLASLVPDTEHILNQELARIKISAPYKKIIHRKYHQLTEAEINSYSNMNDFWNGFIP